MGEDVIAPYLWSRRIRHLDYVVLTHGHSDHMGGLPSILDDFRPVQLWVGAEPESAEWKNVQQHANSDHVAIRPLTRGAEPFVLEEPRSEYSRHPPITTGDAAGNNDSLVLESRTRSAGFCLPATRSGHRKTT